MFGRTPSRQDKSAHCLLKDVGVASFNIQHLHLASYAMEFGQIVDELATREPTANDWKRIDALFGRVTRFVATHFREEEEMMIAQGYPDYTDHKRLHDKFVAELAKIQSQINNRNVKFKGKLSTLLWDWLYRHINEVDFGYREFFQEKGLS
jgi:hemerythrin